MTIGLPAGTPVQWAGNHRYHHLHTDTALDPHSPLHQGFWYAHVGWYIGSRSVLLSVMYALAGPARMLIDAWMRPRTNQEHNGLARDVAADRWYAWLSRPWPYALAMHLHAAIPLFVAWRMWGEAGIAGVWIVLVALYNLGDAIDSVSHLYGTTLPGQRNASRNGRLMGLLTLGEGWHANHHRFPWSARHGLLKRSVGLDVADHPGASRRRVGSRHPAAQGCDRPGGSGGAFLVITRNFLMPSASWRCGCYRARTRAGPDAIAGTPWLLSPRELAVRCPSTASRRPPNT